MSFLICKTDQRRGVAAAAMSTPDKKRQILPHGSQSRSQSRSKNKTSKSKLPVVKEMRTVEVQGLKFTLLKNQKGGEFAEKVCGRKKVELLVMKQLIEDMIAKDFYNSNSCSQEE